MEVCARSVLISKQEVIETGREPFFFWPLSFLKLKEKKRYASGASVVPVDDDGDAFSIATDDSRLDENVPDVDLSFSPIPTWFVHSVSNRKKQ